MIKNLITIINNCLPKKYRNERGSWGLTAVGVSVAGAGLSAYSASTKKKEQTITQLPEYPESEEARGSWWDKLQQWGEDPNYGAISPDWDNIWETVQRQVKQYYSGGPLSTGMRDKLKANVARRNMGDQPASDYLMAASYADEANKMKDIATEQGTLKAKLSEQGRANWLSSIQNLSSMKPNFITGEQTSGGIPWMDITGATLSAAGTAGLSLESDTPTKEEPEQKFSMPETTSSPYQSIDKIDHGDWTDLFKR